MACCETAEAVAPDGTPVLVVRDEAGNLTYTDVNTGAAYAGDISLLQFDLTDRLDDCEGNRIDTTSSNFMLWQEMRDKPVIMSTPWPADSVDACTPGTPPVCFPGVTWSTISPKGDTWEWDGAAWNLVALTPNSKRSFWQSSDGTETIPAVVLDQAYIEAQFAANPGVHVPVNVGAAFPGGGDMLIGRDLTNTDCTRWHYYAETEIFTQFSSMPDEAQLEIQLQQGAGHTAAFWSKAPSEFVDTIGGTNPSGHDQKGYLRHYSSAHQGGRGLAPGQSRRFESAISLQVTSWPTGAVPATLTPLVTLLSFIGSVQYHRRLDRDIDAI